MNTLSSYLILLVIAGAGILFQIDWLAITGIVLVVTLALVQGIVKNTAVEMEERAEEKVIALENRQENGGENNGSSAGEDYAIEHEREEIKWKTVEAWRKQRLKGVSEGDKKHFAKSILSEEEKSKETTAHQILGNTPAAAALKTQLLKEERIESAVEDALIGNQSIQAMPEQVRDAVKQIIKEETLAEFRKKHNGDKK
ncbi:hypothetical protein HY993_01130 [Candidatus Micrarchaeota archaeon]|nr:hypothetical protein [Candidatus Micrarchaeota archaeon]